LSSAIRPNVLVRTCIPNKPWLYCDIPVQCIDRNLLIESVNQLVSLKTVGYSTSPIYPECLCGNQHAVLPEGSSLLGENPHCFSMGKEQSLQITNWNPKFILQVSAAIMSRWN